MVPVPPRTVAFEGGEQFPNPLLNSTMTLFLIEVPLMMVGVAIAVIPVVAMSVREHRRVQRMAAGLLPRGVRPVPVPLERAAHFRQLADLPGPAEPLPVAA